MEKMVNGVVENKEKINMLRTEDKNPMNWIMRKTENTRRHIRHGVVIAVASASLLFAAGCATPEMLGTRPGVVTATQQQTVGRVYEGTIINLQPVRVKDVNPMSGYGYGYIVSGAGAVLGGEAGYMLAQKSNNYITRYLSESVGGVVGTLIARKAQLLTNTRPGYEITVKLNGSNKVVAIAQQTKTMPNGKCIFRINEPVNIVVLGGRARVVPIAEPQQNTNKQTPMDTIKSNKPDTTDIHSAAGEAFKSYLRNGNYNTAAHIMQDYKLGKTGAYTAVIKTLESDLKSGNYSAAAQLKKIFGLSNVKSTPKQKSVSDTTSGQGN